MIKKAKEFLSYHPRLRVALFVFGLLFIFISCLSIFSHHNSQKKMPPSAVATPDTRITHQRDSASHNYQQVAKQQKTHNANYFSTNFHFDTPHKEAVNPVTFYQQHHLEPIKKKPQQQNNQAADPTVRVVDQSATKTAEKPVQKHKKPQYTSDQLANIHHLSEAMSKAIEVDSKSWGLPSMASVVSTGDDNVDNNGQAATSGNGHAIIKSGTILFGVLQTALNSDQAGTPVLANIVSGQYKGAKLLGQFQREGDRLVVQFTQMNIPGRSSSVAINAYAIDSRTAQNALATDVNHHYIARYASLFASGFLQGFGNAFSQVNNPCDGNGNCWIFTNNQARNATTKSAVAQGLGQVGTNWGQAVGQGFNRPPTVKLAQGSGLGILFVKDVIPGQKLLDHKTLNFNNPDGNQNTNTQTTQPSIGGLAGSIHNNLSHLAQQL